MRQISSSERLAVKRMLEQRSGVIPFPDHVWIIVNGNSKTPYCKDCKDLIKVYLDEAESGRPIEAFEDLYDDVMFWGLGVELERRRCDGIPLRDAANLISPNEQVEAISPVRRDDIAYVDMLTETEAALITALTDHHCKDAALRQPVKEFRERNFFGQVLMTEQAEQFLISPALRLLSLAEIETHGVDLLGHTATLDSERWVVEGETVEYMVHLMPADTKVKVCHDVSTAALLCRVPSHLVPKGFSSLIRGEPESLSQPLFVYPGTVLDDLRRLGEDLCGWYGWNMDQALWFVLSNRLMHSDPITVLKRLAPVRHPNGSATAASIRIPHSVTLTLPIHLSAETVGKIFRRIQQDELGLGQRVRLLDDKLIWLFAFVTNQKSVMGVEGEPSLPKKRAMMDRWNRLCQQISVEAKKLKKGKSLEDTTGGALRINMSKWVYNKTELRLFTADFKRAERVLLRSWEECQKRRTERIKSQVVIT